MNSENTHKLHNLKFDNKILRTLPVDSTTENYIRTVNNAILSLVKPTPLKNPYLIATSKSALQLIDLTESDVDEELVQCFSGNKIINGSQTCSQCYAGHQFGSFVGQLGDGCAIYLGEIINNKNQRWELQLKGAGLTPFSRGADGRKVLRSSIREFLCSEFLYYLNIPTTRSASCISSDDYVVRDIYYNGNEINERCAIITRIAETFIRFGTFEIFKTRDELTGRWGPSVGNREILLKLFDYVVETFYPEIDKQTEPDEDINKNKIESTSENKEDNLRNLKCREFFKEVVKRTAETVALWQCYGFAHGVLNTDNMSICGLTLDYGPYAFVEKFNQFLISNGSDHNGRYSFINQPSICRWNLMKLAEMLKPLAPIYDLVSILETEFVSTYKKVYLGKMRSKFGLINELNNDLEQVLSDEKLVDLFLDTLESTGSDLTNGFRNLNLIIKSVNNDQQVEKQIDAYIDIMMNEEGNSLDYEDLRKESRELLQNPSVQYCLQLMEESKLQFAYLEKQNDKIKAFVQFIERYKKTKDLSKEEKADYDRLKWKTFFAAYVHRIKHDLSDKLDKDALEQRFKLMNSNNPKFILRNHLAQRAIAEAEKGKTEEIKKIIFLIENSFKDLDEEEIKDLKSYYRMARKDERCKQITCSS